MYGSALQEAYDKLPDDFMGILIEKDLEKGFDYRRITLERGGVL